MFTDYYGLSFNPFDKQCRKEKDCFQSNDFKQMSSRLSYVRDVRGINVVNLSHSYSFLHSRKKFKKFNKTLDRYAEKCCPAINFSASKT